MSLNPGIYSSSLNALLAIDAPYPLVPREPIEAARSKLAAFNHAALFAGEAIADRTMADACLAGLWLRYDFLDESHAISQAIETPTGSYWHGILHRREPDYGNAKYWFARVGKHAIDDELAAAVSHIACADKLGLTRRPWNAAKFIDLCERAAKTSNPLADFCRQVQRVEWQLLFDNCYRRALGRK